MSTARLYCGDAIAVLKRLPDESVRCCVTSPPYWGLRAYGTEPQVFGRDPDCAHEWGTEIRRHKGGPHGERGALRGGSRAVVAAQAAVKDIPSGAFCAACGAWRGELGLEPTPDLYIEHMVEIFREVRRVLANDGTLWLNMGDCYANDGKWGGETGGKQEYLPDADRKRNGRAKRVTGLKPKDLLMMPARLALALQADGWYLRSQIIWAKPNPMPESVRDRPTTAHEYVFLLTRSERYFYDADAIREKWESGRRATWKTPDGWDTSTGEGGHGSFHKQGREKGKRRSGNKQRDIPSVEDGRGIPNNHLGRGIPWEDDGTGRNARSVWTIATQPYPEAHFATFPEELARRCILAGTSAKGHCPECGKPWVRITETTYRNDTTTDGRPARGNSTKHGAAEAGQRTFASGERTRRIDRTTGWKPTCEHEHEPIPDVVLDPFGGSGTVAAVATGNGRDSIYIDLNPAYLELARQRIGPMLCVSEDP